MPRMKISREGVLLIKSFEGFRPQAAMRGDGRWVIGYGHTASAREGATISEIEAELLLQYDLIPIQSALAEGLSQPVNQHQYDALASFAFSVGAPAFSASDVLSRVNAGVPEAAAAALFAWPETPEREARLRRRAAERALFVANPANPVALADLLSAPITLAPPTPLATAETATVEPQTARIETPPVAEIADVVVAAETRPLDAEAEPAPFPVAGLDALSPAYSAIADGTTPVAVEQAVVEQAALVAGASADQVAALGELEITTADAGAVTAPTPAEPDVSRFDAREALGLNGSADAWSDQTVQPATPKPFSLRRNWPYVLMGAFGLASLAMAMAALRKATLVEQDATQILAIATVLALTGAVCVGVSAYNIYQRLNDDRA